MNVWLRVAAVGLTVVSVACGGGSGGGGGASSTVDALQSSVAAGANAVADGLATVTVTATAKNSAGAALTGKSVAFSTSGANPAAATVATAADGTAQVQLSSTIAGAKLVTVTIDGVALAGNAVATFVAGPPATISFTTPPATGTAGALGSVAVTVADANGNPCDGRNVILSLQGGPGGASLGGTTTTATDGAGTAWFSDLSITRAGTGYQLLATASPASGTSAPFDRAAGGPSPSGSTLAASPTSIPDDGATASTLTATIGDQFGNPIQGKNVTLSATTSPPIFTQPSAPTDASGRTTGSVVTFETGGIYAAAAVDGYPVAWIAVTTTALPPDATQSTITLDASSLQAKSTNASTATVTVKDALGRAIPGATVALTYTGTATISPASAPTNGSGVATFTLKSTTVGTGWVNATINPGAGQVHPAVAQALTFTTPYWTIGGTITGLRANGLVLQTAGEPDLAVGGGNTTFTFANAVAAGTAFNVSVKTQPTGHACSLLNASGNANGNVTSVMVTCWRTWKQVSAGYSHTIAVTTDGRAYAWGHNGYGQVGDGTTTTPRPTPTLVGTSVKSVAAGAYQSFLCNNAGSLYAFGSNQYDQLGVGAVSTLAPVQVSTMPGTCNVVASGEAHTMAINAAGDLYAMGVNLSGQFGKGTNANSTYPTFVRSNVAAAAVGGSFSAILDTGGHLLTAGANGNGQLGDGTTNARNTFYDLGAGWAGVAVGDKQVVAATTGNVIYTWGADPYGNLGNAAGSADVKTPTAITMGAAGPVVAASPTESAAILTNGYLAAWGDNTFKQLATSLTTQFTSPNIADTSLFVAASVGYRHVALITTDGRLCVRGDNSSGQLGTGGTGVVTDCSWIDPP
jgi:alpha-tubulin suppressor-like RCC1 family protein